MSDSEANELWQSALRHLQSRVTRPMYETWLKDTVGLESDEGRLTVGVATPFAVEWLEKRMYALLEETLEGIAGRPMEVTFRVNRNTSPSQSGAGAPSGSSRKRSTRSANGADPVPLNPAYTFDTFVVGKSNQLAHAAAHAVARNPGNSYNPLVIYSGVGLGKTHLLHAVAHEVRASGLTALYVTGEQFTNDFVHAIQRGDPEAFRRRYRDTDVLLLDDVQFIAGKEHSQEAFFHTFNELHTSNRQVVVSSDRPPRALTLMEGRLRSRFEGGLQADIKAPEMETRLAILRSKVERMGVAIAGPVLEFIARRVQRNVRELEGSLNRVLAFADLTREPINEEMASRALADIMLEARRRAQAPGQVISAVATFYKVDLERLKSRKRDKRTARARQVAMYLLREEAQRPLSEIGRLLGGKDHTTVLHACNRIAEALHDDPQMRADLVALQERLHATPLPDTSA